MRIKILVDEYWWGGIIDNGCKMPYDNNSRCHIDIKTEGPDQSSPLFLSSKGRIIHSYEPFKIEFNCGEIIIDDIYNIELLEGFGNLRGAHIESARRFMDLTKAIPNEEFFRVPQYNTWIELMYNQNEKQILEYAHSIVDNGMTPGILMIDEGWSEDYGVFDFYPGRFASPKKMIKELHELGFTIMLWVTPIISPDSNAFREIRDKDFLIKDENGKIAIREWWNGFSCVLDFSNPKATEWFENKLKGIMDKYDVDGFKFDAGDAYFYSESDNTYIKQSVKANTKNYDEIAAKYTFNELRAVYDMGGSPIVCRLQDKKHSWDETGIKRIIPNTVMQGLMGYYYGCPDMIGGGEYGSFLTENFEMDEQLYIRWLETSVLCPMMQFSIAPWRVLSKQYLEIVQNYAALREKYSEYIINLAKNAAENHEPIVRHMAYEFPDQGYECVNDMFMLGDKYLVVPMLEKDKNEKTFKLPTGKWFINDQTIEGGKEIKLHYDLDTLYVFECVER